MPSSPAASTAPSAGTPPGADRRRREKPAAARPLSEAAAARAVYATVLEWFQEMELGDPHRLATRFLRDHAAAVLVMPRQRVVEQLVRDRSVARRIDGSDAGDVVLTALSRSLDMTKKAVAKAYRSQTGRRLTDRRREVRAARPGRAAATGTPDSSRAGT